MRLENEGSLSIAEEVVLEQVTMYMYTCVCLQLHLHPPHPRPLIGQGVLRPNPNPNPTPNQGVLRHRLEAGSIDWATIRAVYLPHRDEAQLRDTWENKLCPHAR